MGERVRRRREALGLTQDEVARGIRALQLGKATKASVQALESGQPRATDLTELHPLCHVLSANLWDFLAGDESEWVANPGGGVSSLGTIRRQLLEGPAPFMAPEALRRITSTLEDRAEVDAADDATVKAARRLEVAPEAVVDAAYECWGQRLTAERDARVASQAAEGASARTLQALRGHVTRDLLEELRPVVARRRGKGAKR